MGFAPLQSRFLSMLYQSIRLGSDRNFIQSSSREHRPIAVCHLVKLLTRILRHKAAHGKIHDQKYSKIAR